jgi:Lar family restriction alleviation protein
MTYYYLKKDESGSLRSVEIDKLINCPFCGSNDNDLETQRIGKSVAIVVNCNHCGCQGPTGYFSTQAETLWNSQTGETLRV